MITWEVLMNHNGRIRNGFFTTQEDARKFYHEWHSVGWDGDMYLNEVD